MNAERDIALIDDIVRTGEAPWIEFKQNNPDPERIGIYCSALANSACAEGEASAYMLWGIDDKTWSITGTQFDWKITKIKNQPLEIWLAQMLSPSPAFSFRSVEHPKGRVVILEIPAAASAPVAFNHIQYIRIGEATPKLSDYPDRHAQLIEKLRPYAWEKGIAKSFLTGDDVLNCLDFNCYLELTKHPASTNREEISDRLKADALIQCDVGDRWNILNLGAILFAKNLSDFGASIERKGVRFVSYSGKNKSATVIRRIDGAKGYACDFFSLVNYINDVIPRNEHIGAALREDRPLFPELAIRELIANALIHQDMTITGAGPSVELFEDRLEITNPGRPLVQVERMIDLPPRSRNAALSSLMRRMRFCEEQGSGLDKVVTQVELFQLPAPNFRVEENSFQAVLYGPRSFADMSPDERVRACYQHAVIKHLSGEKMKNESLRERLGIKDKNATQASQIIQKTIGAGLIKSADPDHPRAGYIPIWA